LKFVLKQYRYSSGETLHSDWLKISAEEILYPLTALRQMQNDMFFSSNKTVEENEDSPKKPPIPGEPQRKSSLSWVAKAAMVLRQQGMITLKVDHQFHPSNIS